ncbi:glutathione S-transferase family protein [Pseudoduganella albidiflava]|nr:glutathione binding-like protein [Pseudoduganella albidiflava]GGY44647.1 thiol:disulfide oxidoreductase [Pseudoduganella albidiflava]
MLTFYTAATPNGHKIAIALHELDMPHEIRRVDLAAGEQHLAPFADMSPNHKIPLIVDDGPPIFESGAILFHLAGKSGRLLPDGEEGRSVVLQWLFLQAAHIGPMLGQLWYFRHADGALNEGALQRYGGEARRLYGVVERQLARHDWLAGGDYSIADIAAWPWLREHDTLGISMADYPATTAWLAKIAARPAVRAALAAQGE